MNSGGCVSTGKGKGLTVTIHPQEDLLQEARYAGRAKTLFQLLMTATVANLTLAAAKTGLMKSKTGNRTTEPSNGDAHHRWIPQR